ncbi:hypothetical protein KUTeg_001346 [Tegillarca granosa]|uniref:Cation efflux protein transmembrane domain-containing protein n=1 Tax=Tegillarca granosa TaxID=220873 RepID=A0ABQ9FR48_TEGGR|nr:hypothetical protein KUTeg_001346 [Tegillarca granosa]
MDSRFCSKDEKVPLKRRLSTGDEPISDFLPKPLDISPESFFLGRVEGSVHSSIIDENSQGKHHVRLTEVAPSHSSILDNGENDEWKMSLTTFSNKKQGPNYTNCSKRLRSYYKAQDELISAYEEMQLEIDDAMDNAETAKYLMKKASFLAKITLLTNVALLLAKLAAAIISGSISIISSLVDSVVDFASGIVIWMAAKIMKKRDPYVYPQGRTKLEPIAIVILAVIMSLASLQLIRESIEKIISLASLSGSIPNVDLATIIITVSAIVIKLILYLVCRRVPSPSIQALAMDHRNDVLSNSVAIVFGYIDQIKLLTGHTAKPDFLKKLTWLSANHHPKIMFVDTVRAFHFGNNFLVEVDVVLPEEMRIT